MNAALAATATRIANATRDAYSFQNFGIKEWTACAYYLLDNGYQVAEVTAILESKLARWASDEAAEPYRADASDFIAFIEKNEGKPSMRKVFAEILESATA